MWNESSNTLQTEVLPFMQSFIQHYSWNFVFKCPGMIKTVSLASQQAQSNLEPIQQQELYSKRAKCKEGSLPIIAK